MEEKFNQIEKLLRSLGSKTKFEIFYTRRTYRIHVFIMASCYNKDGLHAVIKVNNSKKKGLCVRVGYLNPNIDSEEYILDDCSELTESDRQKIISAHNKAIIHYLIKNKTK